ncbi:MAG: SusC/RagA family TonB-linked outer membrane protein [Bacteroidales bacterium]|nr:SusC/RagA family TonB-linked outer membrane protein [Bacteroidales bacterium]
MQKRIFILLVSLLLAAPLLRAQNLRTITGTVISKDDGLPVIGAGVMVKGDPKNGASTDIDGHFTLQVPPTAKQLEVSFIGMKTLLVPISGSKLQITLEPDSEILQEVVVTGMQKMDKRLFTGATDRLDASDVKLDGMADVSRGLEGKSAGVSVQNVSGTFGAAPKIRVRGATSIYGSSKPLWVVDGVIMEDVVEVSADNLSSGDAETLISSAIAGLNADDIESFQILKDGSATSIYGARAMAGVIVVTTKRGNKGQTRINYTGEFTSRLRPSYRNFNIMNSQDQMGVYQELRQKGFLNYADIANASDSGVYGKMYELISQYDATTGEFGMPNTEEARRAYLQDAEYRNTDWFGQLFSPALMHNHSVSVTSGSDKAQYYASLSVMEDPGWSIQSHVQRYTANMNTTFNITKKLSLQMVSNASFRKQTAPGTLGQETDAVSGAVNRAFDINPYSYALNTSRTLDPDVYYTCNYAPFNIFHELENNYMQFNVVDLRYQGQLTWKPIAHTEFNVLGALKYSTSQRQHFIMDDSNQAMAYKAMQTSTIRQLNRYLYKDPDNVYALPVTVLPDGGIYYKATNSMFGYDFRATGAYNNVFADTHILNLYGGIEVNDVERTTDWFRGWGMQYALGEVPSYAYQVFKKGKEQNTPYYDLINTTSRNVAFFANGTYSYKGRYTLNGTVRYEGSNKLGRSRRSRWLPTWNVSGAWNVHEEQFFKSIQPAVSHLSLKASYSLTADSGPDYVTNSNMVIGSETVWRPKAELTETQLYLEDVANLNLTYEKKHELNLGMDIGFADDRISLAADWYKRDNYDLIGVVFTQSKGYKYGNVASMASGGTELSLTTQNVKTRDFNWTTNFIYSHTHNKITRLETISRVIDLVSGSGFALEGYPVRSIFSIPFKGLDSHGLPTFLDQEGTITNSNVFFQEMERLDFLEYSGSADPTDMGSFGNTFSWKGLKLNVFMTYSFGNVVRLDRIFSSSYSDLTAMTREFANRWVVSGDENVTTIPVIASRQQLRDDPYLQIAYNSYNYSTERMARGDFIRLKEVSLSYDFPRSVLDKIHFNALSLKLQATNLALLYADKKLNGQDPEFINAGGVAVPLPKQFTFTLRIGL